MRNRWGRPGSPSTRSKVVTNSASCTVGTSAFAGLFEAASDELLACRRIVEKPVRVHPERGRAEEGVEVQILSAVPRVHEPGAVALRQIQHEGKTVHEHVLGEEPVNFIRRDMALILGRFHCRSVSLLRFGETQLLRRIVDDLRAQLVDRSPPRREFPPPQ